MGAYSVNSAENHRYFRSKVNLRDSDVDPRFNLVQRLCLAVLRNQRQCERSRSSHTVTQFRILFIILLVPP